MISKDKIKHPASQELLRRGIVYPFMTPEQAKFFKFVEDTPKDYFAMLSCRKMGKCLEKGTEVMTPAGSKKIEDVKEGDIVYSLDINGEIIESPVLHNYRQGIQKVFPLTTGGRKIAACTENHLWALTHIKHGAPKGINALCKYHEYYTWGATGTIERFKNSRGVKIIKRYVKIPGGKIKEPLAYVIGALQGDGCCTESSLTKLAISSNSNHIPEKIANILNLKYYKNTGYNYTWFIRTEDYKPIQWDWYFKNFHGKKAHEKHIYWDDIKDWDRESWLNLLAGLLDTDGSMGSRVTGKTRKKILVLSFTTQSLPTIQTIQRLILNLFQVKIEIKQDKREKYKNGPIYYFHMSNTSNVKRMSEELDPLMVCPRKKRQIEWDNMEANNSNPNFCGVLVGEPYETETYDLAIDSPTHLYVLANEGLVTHNSFAAILDAFGYCIRNKNKIVRIVLPTFKQSKDVAYPIFRELLDIFPKDVYPTLRKSEAALYFNTGSIIFLNGSSSDSCEAARGPRADRIYLDEITAFDEDVFSYLMYGILIPQISLADNPKIIATGTPAKNPQHPFYVFEYPKLAIKETLIKYTIDDNSLLTERQKDQIVERYGSRNDPEFRREYMGELITAQDLKVVPEFDKAKHVFSGGLDEVMTDCLGVQRDWHGIIACDLGVTDLTALVGIAVNTYTNKAIVLHERTLHGNTLGEFAKIYLELFNDMKLYCSDITSICDGFEQSMITLRKDHNLHFNRPLKRSVEDNVAIARNFFARDRIIIHESCKYLILQLDNGMFDTNKVVNKDFIRSPIKELGHLDHVMSLMYGLRKVDFLGSREKKINLGNNVTNKPKQKYRDG
jgi:hypothetical protein